MSALFTLGLVLCVMFSGLALDIGRLQLLRTQMQSASDAAALGAELEAERVAPGVAGPYDWVTQGQQDAALNGFTNGQNGATVTVAQNPTSGAYVGRYDAIQVTITQTFKAIFLGALKAGSYTITTQSVALVPPCSYFLGGASASYSYTFQNASASLLANCPVYINNNFIVDGFARGWGFGFDVSGTSASSQPTGWTTQQMENGYGGVPPQQLPTYNTPVLPDPLASTITQPTFSGGCPSTAKTIASGTATVAAGTYTSTNISNATVTLNPGTFCGTASTLGLTITGSTVTLNPGLHIITGGGTWNSSTVTGTGVTLFFTKGNGAGYGQFLAGSVAGGQCTLNLSAPNTTTNNGIPGILFFADRNWVQTAAMDFQLGTYGTFNGDGIWYLPNTGLYIWLNGGFTMPTYGSFVVRNTYHFGTSITQSQNYSWLSGGSPFRTQAVLVQ